MCIVMLLFVLTVSPGNLVVSPSDMDSSVGDTIMLTCEAAGGPDNTFEWTGPTGGVVGTTAMIDVPIESAQSGGTYTCTVSNAAGNNEETATIDGNVMM